MTNKTLIVFLAPSGRGKSTSSTYLKQKYSGEIIKLASPLYDMQQELYVKLGLDITSQDGEFLQFIGYKVQKLSPKFLFNEFLKKYNHSSKSLIINDDCRPHNYEYLKSIGAIFIKISGPSRYRNEDKTPHNTSHPVEWQEPIPYDYEIDNSQSEEHLFEQLDSLMRTICG